VGRPIWIVQAFCSFRFLVASPLSFFHFQPKPSRGAGFISYTLHPFFPLNAQDFPPNLLTFPIILFCFCDELDLSFSRRSAGRALFTDFLSFLSLPLQRLGNLSFLFLFSGEFILYLLCVISFPLTPCHRESGIFNSSKCPQPSSILYFCPGNVNPPPQTFFVSATRRVAVLRSPYCPPPDWKWDTFHKFTTVSGNVF